MTSHIHIIEGWEEQCFNHLRNLVRKYGFHFARKTKVALKSGVAKKGNEYLNDAMKKDFSQIPNDIRKELTVYAVSLTERMVIPKPREVIECVGISCPPDLLEGYKALKKDIVAGVPLYPRLSRKILEIDYADGMFNDWGIIHFHLGTTNDRRHKSLVQGNSHVAYAYLTDDKAYIIAIDTHDEGKWTDEKFLKILKDQHPEAIQPWATDISAESIAALNATQRAQLRKANVNLFTKINETTYISPFGGTTMNGVRVEATIHCNRIYHKLTEIEKFIERHDAVIRSQLPSSEPNLTPVYVFKKITMLAYGWVYVISVPTHHATLLFDDWGVMLCWAEGAEAVSALERHRLEAE